MVLMLDKENEIVMLKDIIEHANIEIHTLQLTLLHLVELTVVLVFNHY